MAKRMKQHEIDELMLNMPLLPKKFGDWMMKAPFKNRDYMFYKRRGKKKHGFCSKCGELVIFENKSKHNDIGRCPSCKSKVTFKAINIAKSFIDHEYTSIIQKMGDGFIVRYFKVRRFFKNYNDDTSKFPDEILESLHEPTVDYYEGSRVYISFNKSGTTQYRYFEEEWSWKTGDYRWMNERKRGGMNNKELLRTTDPFIYKRNLKPVLKNTKWKYCGLDYYKAGFMNIDDYLYTYEKYSGIELMSKIGLDNMLRDIVYQVRWRGSVSGGTINLNKKRLGLDSETLATALKLDLDLDQLERYTTYKTSGHKFGDHDFVRIKDLGAHQFGKVIGYSNFLKAINYLEKQSKKFETEKRLILNTWVDYINQCEYLKLDLEESVVLYPRELYEKHDKYTKVIEDMKSAEIIKKFEDKHKIWSPQLDFTQGNLSIRVASTIDELKKEGGTLGHCVGSFGSRVANTDSIVLFVRTKADTPFYTVQFRLTDQKVIQVQGKKRIEPTKRVSRFLDQWRSVVGSRMNPVDKTA